MPYLCNEQTNSLVSETKLGSATLENTMLPSSKWWAKMGSFVPICWSIHHSRYQPRQYEHVLTAHICHTRNSQPRLSASILSVSVRQLIGEFQYESTFSFSSFSLSFNMIVHISKPHCWWIVFGANDWMTWSRRIKYESYPKYSFPGCIIIEIQLAERFIVSSKHMRTAWYLPVFTLV
jgi:hypothetical protein